MLLNIINFITMEGANFNYSPPNGSGRIFGAFGGEQPKEFIAGAGKPYLDIFLT
jgi:hypothetical protein